MAETIIVLIIIGAISLKVISMGLNSQCPSCEKWWCKKDIGREFLDSYEEFETVTREDIHKDGNGNNIGSTQRKEQILVEYNHYLVYHSCKKCGYNWDTNETARIEL